MNSEAFDREYEYLEKEYENGDISYGEMHDAMKDLQEAQRQQAQDDADAAYHAAMGWY